MNEVTSREMAPAPGRPGSSLALQQAGQARQVAIAGPPPGAGHDHAAAGPAFSFSLRGHSLNPLIDASSPLLALMLRVFGLSRHDDIDELHKRCMYEIESIELELRRLGFDKVTIMTHRYCLCSVIDEAVMSSPWGQESDWAERSLLASLHDETWGGEKFFVILERLLMEPSRYLPIIEFLYLCMCLGYQGRYRVMHDGRMQLEALIKETHEVIRKERGHAGPLSLHRAQHLQNRPYVLVPHPSIGRVLAVALFLAAALYVGFFLYTETYTDRVIAQLNDMLDR